MYKTTLKGMYYIPKNVDENPYSILKDASKRNLNFIIIEYNNTDLFSPCNYKKNISRLFYIQDKINSFEKKYKNTIGLICFKCRSVIGPIRIILSKSIFQGEIFKIKNFHLWCYMNNPTLILTNNNFTHIENDNIKNYFTLICDNFLKSTDNYVNILNKGIKLTPIYTNNGFIYIKNSDSNLFEFNEIKKHILRQLKNGNFYISNSDKLYLNLTLRDNIIKLKNNKDNVKKLCVQINNSEFINQDLKIINNDNIVVKNQNLYNLKKVNFDFEIKNSANKFIILKLTSKNNLFALTAPIYLS